MTLSLFPITDHISLQCPIPSNVWVRDMGIDLAQPLLVGNNLRLHEIQLVTGISTQSNSRCKLPAKSPSSWLREFHVGNL